MRCCYGGFDDKAENFISQLTGEIEEGWHGAGSGC